MSQLSEYCCLCNTNDIVSTGTAYEKKYYEQESLTNTCGNTKVLATGLKCQNLASQVQGDANSVNAIGTMSAAPQFGDNIHTVRNDNSHSGSFDFDILYKNSHNGDISFGASENLSEDPDGSTEPEIAASGNIVHVVGESQILAGVVCSVIRYAFPVVRLCP